MVKAEEMRLAELNEAECRRRTNLFRLEREIALMEAAERTLVTSVSKDREITVRVPLVEKVQKTKVNVGTKEAPVWQKQKIKCFCLPKTKRFFVSGCEYVRN